MKRIRYFTETLLLRNNDHHDPSHISAMHHFSEKCHWIRLDDEHIMGYAEISDEHFTKIVNGHDTVVLHPSLHDKTPVKQHIAKHGKHKHFSALSKAADIADTDTIADVIAKLTAQGHHVLASDK